MPTVITNTSGKPVTLPLNPMAMLPPGLRVVYSTIEPADAIAALGGDKVVGEMGLDVEPIDYDKAPADEGVCPALFASDAALAAVRATANAAMPKAWRFHNVGSVPSADAEVGVDLISDSEAAQVSLEGFALVVDGATPWSGAFTKLIVEDTSGLPVAEIAKAALLANAVIPLHDAGVTLLRNFVVGCTPLKGLRVRADDVVAAGSTIQIAHWGTNVVTI